MHEKLEFIAEIVQGLLEQPNLGDRIEKAMDSFFNGGLPPRPWSEETQRLLEEEVRQREKNDQLVEGMDYLDHVPTQTRQHYCKNSNGMLYQAVDECIPAELYFPGGIHPKGREGVGAQDSEFPFLYNPAEDSYLAYRWDYAGEGPMPPPITLESLAARPSLFLTTHPVHYYSPHVHKPSRISEVYFKKPKTLATNDFRQFCSWHQVKNPNDTTVPGIVVLHPSLQWYRDQGYDAFMFTGDRQMPPEILIMNPIYYVVGVRYQEATANQKLL